MPQVVQFTAPHEVALVDEDPVPLPAGHVRVRTWYSGISAGTEMTAYRGSNPYLSKTWDEARRLFVAGEPRFAYPLRGWGYQEVGEVVEVAADVTEPRTGEVVFGIWGHRSEAVVPVGKLAAQRMPAGTDPIHGVFARLGAIALNAVLAAEVHLGEDVAVFGQGVIGLLATRLAIRSGARVHAIDGFAQRLRLAHRMGAVTTLTADTAGGVAEALRVATDDRGVDTAIELSGNHHALHEAVRSVGADGTVVAASFYQGDAVGLRLVEEFHHNRVRILSSQIGGTPPALGTRWNHGRLVEVFMREVATGGVDVAPLVSHVVDAADAAAAFARIDDDPASVLQTVLRFPGAPA
ncbi:zinc-binding alcohol dehydrogenase [Egicoccus sp. AB-alg6-2]|uniref:zinc-dependent alcohol dehydrogenase n=1 Tax=Egicoccus sp. AB-alg6-2 TaxID=3242692 RepID=UPI00359F0ECE